MWVQVKAIVQRVEALEKKALTKQRKAMAGMFDKANAKEAQDADSAEPATENATCQKVRTWMRSHRCCGVS